MTSTKYIGMDVPQPLLARTGVFTRNHPQVRADLRLTRRSNYWVRDDKWRRTCFSADTETAGSLLKRSRKT
jgi:hypothetical protein